MIKSEIEMHTIEIFEPTMKGRVYMQASNLKNILKQTQKEQEIIFWDKTNKNCTKK